MFNLRMINKGFEDNKLNIETPNGVKVTEKPLKNNQNRTQRVDILDESGGVYVVQVQETKQIIKNVPIMDIGIVTAGIIVAVLDDKK